MEAPRVYLMPFYTSLALDARRRYRRDVTPWALRMVERFAFEAMTYSAPAHALARGCISGSRRSIARMRQFPGATHEVLPGERCRGFAVSLDEVALAHARITARRADDANIQKARPRSAPWG